VPNLFKVLILCTFGDGASLDVFIFLLIFNALLLSEEFISLIVIK